MEIHNMMNNINQKDKFKINITTKGLSRKQIIISIGMNNAESIIVQANTHIANINRAFKGMKSDISADYIYSNNRYIVITTNKISCIDISNISNHEMLEELTQEFVSTIEELWYKYSKNVNITKYSKAW